MSFERVVCGIDRGGESLEAARQALRLASPSARATLLSVVDPIVASPGFPETDWALQGYDADLFDALEEAAQANLEAARTDLADPRVEEAQLVTGSVVGTLLHEVVDADATLLALGVREEHRLLGILGGSTATLLVHRAPCSVLLAREQGSEGPFPRSIVVGTDGSDPSARAVEVAAELHGRLGAGLHALVARPGKDGHGEAAREQLSRLAPSVELAEDGRDPVEALVASEADLVVLGHRGRGGLRALGSVSERVAHRARSSVLIVR